MDAEPLRLGLHKFGVAALEDTLDTLVEYLELVAKWNRAYNLTAVRDPREMVTRHVLDSAAALPYLRGRLMLDAGSGAGFPGIVLAILAPETRWTLTESSGKKAQFLRHAIRQLGLSRRVQVAESRLENYQSLPGFDTVTARALADLATLVGWAAHLLAPDGRLVALKGRRDRIDAECGDLGADRQTEVTPVRVPGLAAERHVVCVERKG